MIFPFLVLSFLITFILKNPIPSPGSSIHCTFLDLVELGTRMDEKNHLSNMQRDRSAKIIEAWVSVGPALSYLIKDVFI